MKKMTCKQLGGVCDEVFEADTFVEMAELSKNHALAMYDKGDQAHIDAIEAMKDTMRNPNDYQTWRESKRKEFEELPEDN